MGIRTSTAAKIVSLRRYIELLQFEERRLREILGTPSVPTEERINAQTNLTVISKKLTNAEREILSLKS